MLSEPANAQLIGSGNAQERTADGAPAASHPAFEPHPIQGWTPDFIPYVLQEAIDTQLYDELMPIAGAEGMKWAKALAQKEGIFTGISGGSTFAVARQVAERAPAGSVILCMLPDTGERYMTTPLFDGIEAEMNEEETRSVALDTGLPVPRRVTTHSEEAGMDRTPRSSSAAAEETLDPDDWTEVQALSHRIVDDAVGYLRDVRDRPVWQDMPAEVKAFFDGALAAIADAACRTSIARSRRT